MVDPPTDLLSFCRICAAACGIVVSVERGTIVKVRGDTEHLVSRGYTCAKGRALPQLHHAADRLDVPRLRGSDVDWDVMLDDLASVIGSTINDRGPDSIALYLATGLAYDSVGQVASGMWMGSIGSSSFYTAATVDNAPVLVAAEMVAGHPMLNPVWDPEAPGLLLLVGTNPVVSHGYGTTLPDPVRRLRDYRDAGGCVWVLDPRRTESAAHADDYLSVRPGSDVAVLAALANQLLLTSSNLSHLEEVCHAGDIASLRIALEPFTLANAATAADVSIARLEELVAALISNHGSVAAFCGTGTTMSRDGILVEWLRWVLLILTDSLDRPEGMRFNRGVVNQLRPSKPATKPLPGPGSRPDLGRVAGQMPVAALVDEIESGSVRVLVVTGGNPLSAFPEPDRLREALASLEALVVIDVSDTELVSLATHALPALAQLERSDLALAEHVALRSGMQFTPPVVAPGSMRRSLLWMFASLAERAGSSLLGGARPEDVSDETFLSGLLGHGPLDAADVITAGPRGIDLEPTYGWVRKAMLPDARWRIAPKALLTRLGRHLGPEAGLVLIPRREANWSNSVRAAGAGDEPVIRLNPVDASGAGVGEGSWVALQTVNGSLVATVRLDESLRPGAVSVTHGHPGALTGTLTSAHRDVDPLTAMPLASGVPVVIEPLGM
ncbi:BisC Anaerobic dehydrogenases, typically selenocysteine-containing [Acidimicrobiia bacterium]